MKPPNPLSSGDAAVIFLSGFMAGLASLVILLLLMTVMIGVL